MLTFQPPVNAKVRSPFGSRVHPITKKVTHHGGIDLPVATGTPVSASAAGVVTHAGAKGAAGLLVQIKHAGGAETQYMHNSKVLVKVGQQVQQGDKIALAGSTGASTGPHVHFAVKVNGKNVDPVGVLSKGLNIASGAAAGAVAAVNANPAPFAIVLPLIAVSVALFLLSKK